MSRAAPAGLDAVEAASRLALHGPNELASRDRSGWLTLVAGVVREPMFMLLIGASAVYFLLGDLEEAIVLGASIGVVVLITLYQERKSERALEALRDLSSPRALVVRDACVRLLPGVMGGAESAVEESLSAGLLEYPQYTRPAEWEGRAVPPVLLSGDHAAVARWRREQAETATRTRRPELWNVFLNNSKTGLA